MEQFLLGLFHGTVFVVACFMEQFLLGLFHGTVFVGVVSWNSFCCGLLQVVLLPSQHTSQERKQKFNLIWISSCSTEINDLAQTGEQHSRSSLYLKSLSSCTSLKLSPLLTNIADVKEKPAREK